jgi:hypothetical protein
MLENAGLTDFLQQLPLFIIVMFCGAGLALVGSMVLIIAARRRRAARVAALYPTPQMASAMPLMSYTPSDMPDLDALLRGDPAPSPPRASRGGSQTVELSDGGSAEAIELISVMRDITAGGLIVQMNGKTYRITGDMSDGEFRQKMMSILKELAQSAGSSAPAPSVADAPRPSLTNTPTPTLTSPPPPASAAFDLPKFSTESSPTPMTRRELKQAANAPVPEINIAGAIEAFLQHKLATTGAFAGRSLHVKPASDGGIRIQVDNTYYETVDEIIEDDVKAFLQTTIAEWQSRQ